MKYMVLIGKMIGQNGIGEETVCNMFDTVVIKFAKIQSNDSCITRVSLNGAYHQAENR